MTCLMIVSVLEQALMLRGISFLYYFIEWEKGQVSTAYFIECFPFQFSLVLEYSFLGFVIQYRDNLISMRTFLNHKL